VDPNDPHAIMAAYNRAADIRAEQKFKKLLDESLQPMQEKERFEAMGALGDAYQAWKEYDEDGFQKLLRESGVSVGKNGVDWQKTPPYLLKTIVGRMNDQLAKAKAFDSNMDEAFSRAISSMPKDPDGTSLWDESLTSALKTAVRQQIRAGAPCDTKEDCDLIVKEAAREIWDNDIKRLAERAQRISKAIAANRGASQKVEPSGETPPPVEAKDDDLTSEERHKKIREAIKRDRTLR
jgi:hypothetical protein